MERSQGAENAMLEEHSKGLLFTSRLPMTRLFRRAGGVKARPDEFEFIDLPVRAAVFSQWTGPNG